MYVGGGLSMELSASYMLGIYPSLIHTLQHSFLNLASLILLTSRKTTYSGLFYTGFLWQGGTSYMPLFKLLNSCKHGSLQALL